MTHEHRGGWGGLALALAAGLALTGCGTPGAPLAPSLNLPDPVTNLAAVRTGDQVALTWTMPKKNTDKLLMKGNVAVHLCRKELGGLCAAAGDVALAPGAEGTFTDTLPPGQAAGIPRALTYFVELKNARGRSAGMSNSAMVVAGQAPAGVEGLDATVIKAGVVLHWKAGTAGTSIRLHRKLVAQKGQAKPTNEQGLLAPPPEPNEQNLLVEAGVAAGHALDKGIRFGETYEYRAQRVARVTVDGQTLELAGPLSTPVRVEARDVFPPAVPTGLAAVATAAEGGAEASIDLSWQPGTEADLAGYAVYRSEAGGAWERISPTEPAIGPAFHDTKVLAGHTYTYAVTAVDQGGHESARSVEAQETVPNP